MLHFYIKVEGAIPFSYQKHKLTFQLFEYRKPTGKRPKLHIVLTVNGFLSLCLYM